MEFEIIFCNDGILRLRNGNNPLIPLKFIQENNKEEDYEFWFNYWNQSVIFEKDLTFGKFLQCIEPWESFFSKYTKKSIKDYIKESKKPKLVNDSDQKIDWISLSYTTELSLNIEYDLSNFTPEKISDWFNKERLRRLTGDFDISNFYSLIGYKIGKIEQYGIDYLPMNEVANIPIVLNNKQKIIFNEQNGKKILGEEYELFKQKTYGINILNVEKYKYIYIEGKKNHALKDIIDGVFEWFPYSIENREAFNESIELAVSELNDMEEDVINQENAENVVISTSAFEDLNNYYDDKNNYFESLLKQAKQKKDVILKIGKIKVAEVFENRIYSYIIKTKNKATKFISDKK